jgi:hypothetical protein
VHAERRTVVLEAPSAADGAAWRAALAECVEHMAPELHAKMQALRAPGRGAASLALFPSRLCTLAP